MDGEEKHSQRAMANVVNCYISISRNRYHISGNVLT
jgi:hypothetical protein